MNTCTICGATFPPAKENKITCSPECRKVYARKRWHERREFYQRNKRRYYKCKDDGLTYAREWLRKFQERLVERATV